MYVVEIPGVVMVVVKCFVLIAPLSAPFVVEVVSNVF